MRVSVVIAAFNAAHTLPETLASVHAQTRAADEINVVDDGSTDDTGAVARTDYRVRTITLPRGGPAAAQNTGVAAATGDAVAFLDADDLWTPRKLALQTAALQAGPALDAVFGHVAAFVCPSLRPEQGARYALPPPAPGWLGGAMLLRRSVFERVGPFDPRLRIGHFIDWMHRARLAGFNAAMLDDVVLRRRLHPGSLSHRSAARDGGLVRMAREAIARQRAGS